MGRADLRSRVEPVTARGLEGISGGGEGDDESGVDGPGAAGDWAVYGEVLGAEGIVGTEGGALSPRLIAALRMAVWEKLALLEDECRAVEAGGVVKGEGVGVRAAEEAEEGATGFDGDGGGGGERGEESELAGLDVDGAGINGGESGDLPQGGGAFGDKGGTGEGAGEIDSAAKEVELGIGDGEVAGAEEAVEVARGNGGDGEG